MSDMVLATCGLVSSLLQANKATVSFTYPLYGRRNRGTKRPVCLMPSCWQRAGLAWNLECCGANACILHPGLHCPREATFVRASVVLAFPSPVFPGLGSSCSESRACWRRKFGVCPSPRSPRATPEGQHRRARRPSSPCSSAPGRGLRGSRVKVIFLSPPFSLSAPGASADRQ